MTAICPDYLSEGLEKVFTDIQNRRMASVPILNSQLEVEVVGMQSWDGHCLGILITPWFMNLMLLPNEGDDWSDLPPGSTQQHVFPSGPYVFIVGEEEGIGHYQMCSLFSPMYEFEHQASAVATAEAVMDAIMQEENQDQALNPRNESQGTDLRARPDQDIRPTLSERMDTPLSRRDLLRSVFPGGARK